jgi:2,3-bisphosphoglycerate-independent phosphoglycerate mutase
LLEIDYDKSSRIKLKNFNIATISGRYFAMDRDQKWDRIELASQAILNAIGKKFNNAFDGVNNSYQENITDELNESYNTKWNINFLSHICRYRSNRR